MNRQDVVLLLTCCLLFSGCATLQQTQADPSNDGFVTLASMKEVKFFLPENKISSDPGKRILQEVEKRLPIKGKATSLMEVLSDPTLNARPIEVLEIQTGIIVSVIPAVLARGELGHFNIPSNSVIRTLTYRLSKVQPVFGFELGPDGKKVPIAKGTIFVSGLVKNAGTLTLDAASDVESLKYSIDKIFNRNKKEGIEPDIAILTRVVKNRIYRYYIPVDSGDVLAAIAVQNGDRILFTNALLLPDVVAGKAAGRMRARLAEKRLNTSNKRLPFRILRR